MALWSSVSLSKLLYAVLVCCAAVLAAWMFPEHLRFASNSNDFDWGRRDVFDRLPSVPVVHWADTSAAQIAAGRLPVVVKGSDGVEWAKQPLEDVLGLSDDMEGVRMQRDDPVFVLRAQSGKWAPGPGLLDRVLLLDHEAPYRVSSVNVRSEEFFKDNTAGEYWYFTTPLEAWQPPLREQVVASMTVGENDAIEPQTEDGAVLPWEHQIWGGIGLDTSAFRARLFPNGTMQDPSRTPAEQDGPTGSDDAPDAADATVNNGTSTDPHAMLWFSQRLVTAHMHYDRTHNFFVQLHGEKRVVLAPPDVHHDVRMHPSLHPSYRQSQLPPATLAAALAGGDATGLRNLVDSAYSVVLQPGDMLYLPPFWFHAITALSPSLSLSVVSPSEEEMVFAKAYWTPVPFKAAGTSRRSRTIVAHMLLTALLVERSTSSPQTFIRDLLRSRFIPLYTGSAAYSSRQPFTFPACSLPRSFECHRTAERDVRARRLWQDDVGDTVASAVGDVWAALRLPHDHTSPDQPVLSPAVTDIVLGDYVENVASWAVGPCNVALFLATCFDVQ